MKKEQIEKYMKFLKITVNFLMYFSAGYFGIGLVFVPLSLMQKSLQVFIFERPDIFLGFILFFPILYLKKALDKKIKSISSEK